MFERKDSIMADRGIMIPSQFKMFRWTPQLF
jgi:hypothetical protein